MAPVQSTPTAADALEQRKTILAENAGFVRDRDRAKAECHEWEAARDAVKAEMGAINGLSQVTREVDQAIAERLSGNRAAKQKELDDLNASIEAKKAEITANDMTITSQTATIVEQGKALETIKANTATHVEALHTAKDDHSKFLEKAGTEQAVVTTELTTSRKEIDDNRKERLDYEAHVRDEDKRLATRGADLAIYENRIRRQAAAIGYTLPETI